VLPHFSPTVGAPELGETLLLYITATVEVVSMVLIIERQESCPDPSGSPAVRHEALAPGTIGGPVG
jgi:hypothetical protein